jgi:hypothetical protein
LANKIGCPEDVLWHFLDAWNTSPRALNLSGPIASVRNNFAAWQEAAISFALSDRNFQWIAIAGGQILIWQAAAASQTVT